MEIVGLSISNFRSIGKDPVEILPIKKINILIGQNNSGKSNVIKAIQKIKSIKNNTIPLKELDFHNRDQRKHFKFTFHIKSEDQKKDLGIPHKYEGPIYFTYEVGENNGVYVNDSCLHPLSWDDLNFVLQSKGMGTFTRQPRDEELKTEKNVVAMYYLGKFLDLFPEVHIVPQFRKISPGDKYTLEGQRINETLGEFQHPTIGDDKKKDKFIKIEQLMRRLLHLPGAKLEVDTRNKILIENNNLRLPLESYGTGVHELIILATALYSFENVLFCIEEPEIHLHPKLQKELLKFIKEETSNTYILTTHSNAFLSIDEDVQVVHLWQKDNVTHGQCTKTSLDTLRILNDLGIKPSDILQANFVIWVEGPSDRIYINRWISLLNGDLKECIDYTIMFYGGKLLSHVSMEREGLTPESFVRLLRINQHSAIVIDSDRDKEYARPNKTKQRVIKECENNGVYCWFTYGREIENYLPSHAVETVFSILCGVDKKLNIGRYDRMEEVIKKTYKRNLRASNSYEKSKPYFARKIAPYITLEDINNQIDLKRDLKKLIEKIENPFND